MEQWVSILLAAASGLGGAGVGYGLTLGRLRTVERDIERLERTSATKESVDGFKSRLDEISTDLKAVRSDMHALLRREPHAGD